MTRSDYISNCILYGMLLIGGGGMTGCAFGEMIAFLLGQQEIHLGNMFGKPAGFIGIPIGMLLGTYCFVSAIKKSDIPAYCNSPPTWTEAKNSRRIELIEKQQVGPLTVREMVELNNLQAQAMDYRESIAPLIKSEK